MYESQLGRVQLWSNIRVHIQLLTGLDAWMVAMGFKQNKDSIMLSHKCNLSRIRRRIWMSGWLSWG
jgi:hypothetical protein